MVVADNTELVTALAQFDAKRIVGTPESVRTEFKRADAYSGLVADKHKWELAKDVAALANAEGGLIVIGIGTTKEETSSRDVATDVLPFDPALYDLERIKGVLREWLHPPQHPGLRFFLESQGATKGFLVITVEPVPEHDRYVLTTKTETDDGRLKNAVGLPVRAGEDTRWFGPQEIYRLVNDGYLGRRAGGSGAVATARTADPAAARERAENALDALEHSQGWGDQPVLMWQSYVEPPPVSLPGLFGGDGVRGFLDGPNGLRSGGFHFHNPYVPVQATSVGLIHPSRDGVALAVVTDGTVTAGVVANNRLLARSQPWSQELPVSPVVLTEFTYEYFRLVDEQVLPLAEGLWRHRVVVRRMAAAGVTLSPGRAGQAHLHTPRPAQSDNLDKAWAASGEPSVDAATSLAVFYNLFGLDADANPWVDGDRVDIEEFLADMRETPPGPAPG